MRYKGFIIEADGCEACIFNDQNEHLATAFSTNGTASAIRSAKIMIRDWQEDLKEISKTVAFTLDPAKPKA